MSQKQFINKFSNWNDSVNAQNNFSSDQIKNKNSKKKNENKLTIK